MFQAIFLSPLTGEERKRSAVETSLLTRFAASRRSAAGLHARKCHGGQTSGLQIDGVRPPELAASFILMMMRVCFPIFWNLLEGLWFLERHRRMLEEVMKRHAPPAPIELVVAPAAIERALDVYEQLRPHDPSVILQARKILTQHIFGLVDQGEQDEQRLTVCGLAHLKAVERDHEIKSAQAASKKLGRNRASS